MIAYLSSNPANNCPKLCFKIHNTDFFSPFERSCVMYPSWLVGGGICFLFSDIVIGWTRRLFNQNFFFLRLG